MQRVIAAQSDGPRRDHYMQLADHWLALRELRLPLVACGSATWQAPSLSVSIRPELAVRDADDSVLVMKLWLKEEPQQTDAVKSCLWLLNNQMDSLVPGGIPVVADIRRRKIHNISVGVDTAGTSRPTSKLRRRAWPLCGGGWPRNSVIGLADVARLQSCRTSLIIKATGQCRTRFVAWRDRR